MTNEAEEAKRKVLAVRPSARLVLCPRYAVVFELESPDWACVGETISDAWINAEKSLPGQTAHSSEAATEEKEAIAVRTEFEREKGTMSEPEREEMVAEMRESVNDPAMLQKLADKCQQRRR